MTYALFMFMEYEAQGGANDFVGLFDSVDAAKRRAEAEMRQNKADGGGEQDGLIAQIADVSDGMRVVCYGAVQFGAGHERKTDFQWEDRG